jgi:hypothetical protein
MQLFAPWHGGKMGQQSGKIWHFDTLQQTEFSALSAHINCTVQRENDDKKIC